MWKVIIGGFHLDKGGLSRCYGEISNLTVSLLPFMLFQAHGKTKTVVEHERPGTEKMLSCEAKSQKAKLFLNFAYYSALLTNMLVSCPANLAIMADQIV